jgi:hypothetical protein
MEPAYLAELTAFPSQKIHRVHGGRQSGEPFGEPVELFLTEHAYTGRNHLAIREFNDTD